MTPNLSKDVFYNVNTNLIHMFTIGSAGMPMQAECMDRPSNGTFQYVNNMYNGFTDLEANDKTFRIRFFGVDIRAQIVQDFTVTLGFQDIQ